MADIGFLRYRKDALLIHQGMERLQGAGILLENICLADNPQEVIAALERGDRLVVCSLSDISVGVLSLLRSLTDIVHRGASLCSLDETWLDMNGNYDWGPLLEGLTEFWSRALSVRTKEALSEVRAGGKRLGRPVGSVNKDMLRKYKLCQSLYQNTDSSVRSICQRVGVDEACFYRYLRSNNIATHRRKSRSTRTGGACPVSGGSGENGDCSGGFAVGDE